jgi:hypothetical protein
MDKVQLRQRIEAIDDNDQWVQLYIDYFGKEPLVSGAEWGAAPIESVVDAIVNDRPLPDPEPIPAGLVY